MTLPALYMMSADGQKLVSYWEKNDVVLFVEYAGLVVLVYEYFLTLGPEVSFVWSRGPWNLGKVLFFLIRYSTFVSTSLVFYVNTSRSISLPTCPFWLDAGLYGNIFVVILVEFILGLRVWALWGRSKRVAICLMATFFGLTAFGLYKVITIRETQTTFSIEYFRISGQCPPRFSGVDGLSGSNALTSGFIILVLYELVVLILTLLKASNQGWLGPHGSESRFINGFLSQGVAYNCLILVGSTINIIARYKLPSAYVNLFTDLQPVIHTVLTSRMMFYLRKNAFDHETPASDILTGIVGFNPSLPLVRPPTESCPQMSVLDLGSPLGVWEHTNWKQEDSV